MRAVRAWPNHSLLPGHPRVYHVTIGYHHDVVSWTHFSSRSQVTIVTNVEEMFPWQQKVVAMLCIQLKVSVFSSAVRMTWIETVIITPYACPKLTSLVSNQLRRVRILHKRLVFAGCSQYLTELVVTGTQCISGIIAYLLTLHWLKRQYSHGHVRSVRICGVIIWFRRWMKRFVWWVEFHLRQASVSMQSQHCDDTSNIGLIENSGKR